MDAETDREGIVEELATLIPDVPTAVLAACLAQCREHAVPDVPGEQT